MWGGGDGIFVVWGFIAFVFFMQNLSFECWQRSGIKSENLNKSHKKQPLALLWRRIMSVFACVSCKRRQKRQRADCIPLSLPLRHVSRT